MRARWTGRQLPIQGGLEERGLDAKCGVLIIDLAARRIVEAIEFHGKVTDMFDVAVLPGVRNPTSVGPATVEMIQAVSVAREFGPLSGDG